MVSFFGLKFGADKRRNKDAADPVLPPSQHEEWEKTRPSYKDGYISPYAALQSDIEEGICRPRTAQSSTHPGNGRLYVGGHLMASSMSNLHDSSGFRGVGATAGSGSRPGSQASLRKTARSEANLRSDYLIKNISATSLAAPPPTSRLGDSTTSLDAAPRPGTAHSMRYFGQASTTSTSTSTSTNLGRKPSLEINVGVAASADISTPTFGVGAPPKSPLGQYELASPVKTDTASLFGDEPPEKIAHEITSRITRMEEIAKAKIADEERRRVQAELEAQRRRNMEASGSITVACPSPPASVEGENEKSVIFVPGPNLNPRLPGGPFRQDGRRQGSGPRGQVPMYGPAGQRPGPGLCPQLSPRPQISTASSDEKPASRGGRVLKAEILSPSPKLPPAIAASRERDISQGGDMMSPQKREGSQPRKTPTPQKLLIPQSANDQLRGTTTSTNSAIKAPPRSPLFQQMNPFDVHSDEEIDEYKDEPTNIRPTTTATTEGRRAPYGIPSPPLSHRQRPSDEHEDDGEGEEEEGMPIIQTVQAKRDTILVGGPGRTSLGLQIEEFEKTLQQAQAMSALENKLSDLDMSSAVAECFGTAAAAIATTANDSGTRSRADSNQSSNYSEMSESPMTIEPPLVSPKPFPLSPRPIGPAIRSHHHPSPADTISASPLERPSLEARSERTFGPYRRETDDSSATTQSGRRPTLEERPESPAAVAGRPSRPRVGGPVAAASGLRRPMLEEYGKVKVNTSLPSRILHRPGPDEYGPVRIKRTESPFQSESSFSVESSTFRMDSPILKAVRYGHGHSIGQGSEDSSSGSSTSDSVQTSRTNSPVPTSTGSYSVFSPPPQQPSSAAAVKRMATTLPSASSSSLTGLYSSQQPEWYGPAPTAPPTSPLPIPERGVRRKNTLEVGSTGAAAATPPQSKLASSASIVPDIDANPNWPLPGPSTFVFPPPPVPQQQPVIESGFAARRSLLRDKRAPPAPLNIAATKYADEVVGGDLAAGPWAPDAAQQPLANSLVEDGRIVPASRMLASTWEAARQDDDVVVVDGGEFEDKSSAIGVARGLSIRYDRIREQQRRGRGRTRQRQMAAAWRVDEDTAAVTGTISNPTSPTTGEPFDRLLRPNHGLRSPTGIADEEGIRFI